MSKRRKKHHQNKGDETNSIAAGVQAEDWDAEDAASDAAAANEGEAATSEAEVVSDVPAKTESEALNSEAEAVSDAPAEAAGDVPAEVAGSTVDGAVANTESEALNSEAEAAGDVPAEAAGDVPAEAAGSTVDGAVANNEGEADPDTEEARKLIQQDEMEQASGEEPAVSNEQEDITSQLKEEGKKRSAQKEKEAKALARRQERHKRRIRNQILAWILMIAILLGLVAGGYFGYGFVRDRFFGGNIPGIGNLFGAGTAQGEASNENTGSSDGIEGETPEGPAEGTESVDAPTEDVLAGLIGEEETLEKPEEQPELPAEPTFEEKLDALVDEIIAGMSLEDRVAGLFVVTPESITGVNAAVKAGNGTKEALEKYSVGGLVYASRNVQSEEQFAEMMSTTLSYVTYPTFLAVEEEGGSNSPLGKAGIGEKAEAAAVVAQTGDTSTAYESGKTIAQTLSKVGVTVNIGPVADISSIENSVLKDRSYGNEPNSVYSCVASCVQGMKDQGVTPCLKYFPGLGGTSEDPAKTRATSDRTLEDIQNQELVVYRRAIDDDLVNMIMISNVAIPSLDEANIPCSLSGNVVTGMLRDQLGYKGVIISGSLSDACIKDYYGADEAAIMALKAGCDMLFAPEKFEVAYNGVLEAVQGGVISEERINDALKRVYRIKYADQIAE